MTHHWHEDLKHLWDRVPQPRHVLLAFCFPNTWERSLLKANFLIPPQFQIDCGSKAVQISFASLKRPKIQQLWSELPKSYISVSLQLPKKYTSIMKKATNSTNARLSHEVQLSPNTSMAACAFCWFSPKMCSSHKQQGATKIEPRSSIRLYDLYMDRYGFVSILGQRKLLQLGGMSMFLYILQFPLSWNERLSYDEPQPISMSATLEQQPFRIHSTLKMQVQHYNTSTLNIWGYMSAWETGFRGSGTWSSIASSKPAGKACGS